MILTILDPSTGNRTAVEVPAKAPPRRRVWRWALRELDRMASDRKPCVDRR